MAREDERTDGAGGAGSGGSGGIRVAGIDLSPFDAVVFDCDGTLVDTEPLTLEVMVEVLEEMGLEFTMDDYRAIVGRAWPHSSAYLREQVGVTDVDAYLERLRDGFVARHDEVEVFDDAVALARSLRDGGRRIAVCTSSGRVHLDRVLAMDALDGLAFDAEVTREDTEHHKPRPEPYLLAAERIGVDPASCLAIEDSPAGATAALAAGMRVVVVDRGQHDPEGFTGLDVAITTTLTP